MRASVDQLEGKKIWSQCWAQLLIYSKIGEGRELHQLLKNALTEIGTFLDKNR